MKVIVVDDAAEVLQLVSKTLSAAGHEVVGYQSAEALEDKAALEKPDVILLDVVMPDRNGYQALRGLKKKPETKWIPVVVISSKKEPSDIEWGKSQGADDYLTKPFTPEALKSVVERFRR